MPEDSEQPAPDTGSDSGGDARPADPGQLRFGLSGPLIFGVIAATIEFAIVLWALYC
jgi:hypothetical protein